MNVTSRRPCQEPFTDKKFKAAMGSVGHMKCGGNLFWQDLLASVSPGVPESTRAVNEYKDHYFKTRAAPTDARTCCWEGISGDFRTLALPLKLPL